MDKDLFGEEIKKDVILRDKFLEPPFTVLDTRGGTWQARKKKWMALGIKSEVGRNKNLTHVMPMGKYNQENMSEEYYAEGAEVGSSVFDPALTELLLRWFAPEGGTVLDPFAGGSVRGIVSNYLGYQYTGIELRLEQVKANRIQGAEIIPDNQPCWIDGDSDQILDELSPSIFKRTPIEEHVEIWIKREDLFNICGANGAKSRTAYTLIDKAIQEGYAGVTTAGSRKSPQINIVAQIARELGVEFVAHCPQGELSEELQDARKAGAKIKQYRAGYNSVIKSRCKQYAEENNFFEIPFGMISDEAITQTKAQVDALPVGVKRIVITVGSGMNLAGLLWGLVSTGQDIPVLGVQVGADFEKTLDLYAPPGWRGLVTIQKSQYDYHYEVEDRTKYGIEFDPIYEAKCLEYLLPGDLFWVIGCRRTLLPEGTPKNSYSNNPRFDFVLSCPPYADLEVYSDDPDDLSNMPYPQFVTKYRSIIRKTVDLMKPGSFAAWIVGEVRDKDGNYYGLVPDTFAAFTDAGALFYNDAILLNVIGSASMRADRIFGSGKKLVKVHQNVLIFKKP